MKHKVIFNAEKYKLSIEIDNCSVEIVVVNGVYSDFWVNLPSQSFGINEFIQVSRHIERITNVIYMLTHFAEKEYNEQSHIKFVALIRNVLNGNVLIRDNWQNCEIVLKGELNA
jgi:hypothetical protein